MEVRTIENTFGKRLIEAREDKKLSQKAFALSLGISPTRLNYWEKDKSYPDVNFIKAICAALDINSDWLIGISEQKEKPTDSAGEPLSKRKEIEKALIKKMADLSDEDFDRFSRAFDALFPQTTK